MMGEALNLFYCYEGTNITGEKVVNRHKMQLNDALIESYADIGREGRAHHAKCKADDRRGGL